MRNSTSPILPTASVMAPFRSLCLWPALLAAAGLLPRAFASPPGANVLAGAALLLLLVVNIRNAWDLMLALANGRKSSGRRTSAKPQTSAERRRGKSFGRTRPLTLATRSP